MVVRGRRAGLQEVPPAVCRGTHCKGEGQAASIVKMGSCPLTCVQARAAPLPAHLLAGFKQLSAVQKKAHGWSTRVQA